MINRKGQTRIVGEMLLFAVGVMILSYILITFGIVQTGVNELSVVDQLRGVNNYITTTFMTVANTESSRANMTIELPLRVSGFDYIIEIYNDEETLDDYYLVTYLADEPSTNTTEQLFNSRNNYIIEETVLRSTNVHYVVKLEDEKLSIEYFQFPEVIE
ncbi:hypothetical protein CL614_07450 [archaeon]|nr:hypothetical protein [archaeon]|tara:strand:- start:1254 stop:1730 length:477 start_codon:yes stop_codon:yes gene_type:complete